MVDVSLPGRGCSRSTLFGGMEAESNEGGRVELFAFTSSPFAVVRLRVVTAVFVSLLTGAAWAGGGPRNVAVVINQNSSTSREIGRYYQAARGIPDSNICTISCPDQEIVSWQVCERQIREPLRRFLSDPVVGARVDYIVLTKGVPLGADYVDGILGGDWDHNYSVASVLMDIDRAVVDLTGPNGIADGKPDNATPCASPYGPVTWMTYGFVPPQAAWSHTLFDSNVPGDALDINKRVYLITRLDAFTVDQVKAMIDRAAYPALDGVFVLDRNTWTSGDYGKANTRLGNQATSAYDYLVRKGCDVQIDMGQQFLFDIRGVMGYFSWASHDVYYSFGKYVSNVFVPGSIADTYYSYSGRTFDDPGTPNRAPLIADLFACGLCGAAGYVSEPQVGTASYANILFDRYAKGYNLAESFYMACPQMMWKTVVVGDPLMAPYASPPLVTVDLDHVLLHGVETIAATASDASGVKKVEFYLDDVLVATSTQPPYSATLDTNEFAIGPHVLEVIAYENSALATQGSARLQVTIDNEVSAIASIHQAFQYGDGQFVKLRDKVVTAGTDEIGDGFYIEESDRSCGVKVLCQTTVRRGDVVTLIGSVGSLDGQRLISSSSVSVVNSGAAVPGPLMTKLASLGGAAVGSLTLPVGNGCGARNVALLVRAAGRVTSVEDGAFYLNDGSVAEAVRVVCPNIATPALGSVVAVTGICEAEYRNQKLAALLRPRGASDITAY